MPPRNPARQSLSAKENEGLSFYEKLSPIRALKAKELEAVFCGGE